MLDWKDIWRRRFHAWVWLLLPALVFMGLMRLTIELGWQEDPTLKDFGVRLGITLVTLALCVLGLWRMGRAHWDLMQVAKNLVNGRLESRANTAWWGMTGELAESLNTLGKMLSQVRDHQDLMVMQTTTRLRQDQERLTELNTELRRALRESQEAARVQSELFSNLSHELRTPLTAVLGHADLLRRTGLAAAQGQQLETLERSARGMLGMINDLLDWSRIEAGRLVLHQQPFDLTDAVEEVTTLLAPLAYDKGLELSRIVYHDVPPQVTGDAARLKQILTNLLSNAIKFTSRGEVVLRVMHEREEGERQWLQFSVTDTGIGIAQEAQQALFRPFRQAGESQGGSGLGLAITRKLTELMSGRIELESELGRGSSFRVTLGFASAVRVLPQASDPRLRELPVWVLEPQETAARALTHWLEFWGLKLRRSASLDSLLEMLVGANRPALLVLGASRAQAEAWTTDPRFGALCQRGVPVLVLVASASPDLHARLTALGAAACLPKCAPRKALLDSLLSLVSGTVTPKPLAGYRALVAENNPANLLYLRTLCADLGLEVLAAQDGVEAVALWQTARPEFVLLDARMPRLDGAGAARRIRAATGGEAPRILAVSAHLEPHEEAAFRIAGANGILMKPFDAAQLLAALAPGAAVKTTAARLVTDPEMLVLLREELPLQWAAVRNAMQTGDVPRLREAAHTLHGTAAFYHLDALRKASAGLEQAIAQGGDIPAALGTLQAAVTDTLAHL